MARPGLKKRVVVGVEYFDSTLLGWWFDAQALSNYGDVVWRWSNATENDGKRPNPGGMLVFENVPVSSDGRLQIIASSPDGKQSFAPQASFAPLKMSVVTFLLTPDEARNTQTGPSTGESVTGPGLSSMTTPAFKFSGSIFGTVNAEAGSSNATTKTAPQSTRSSATAGQTTTTIQVLRMSLKRVMHIDGVADLNMPSPVAFG